MTTHHDDDREFDAFLRGEDDLSSLLRQAPQPEVPPALDARILAQARAALAEPAHAGKEAANDPAPAPWRVRMRVPLGLAATVVIGVSLSLRWTGWQEGTPVVLVSDSDPVAPAAAPPPPAAAARPEAPVETAPPPGQDAPAAAAPPVRARAAPRPAPAPVAAAPAEEAVFPPPPPPPAPAPMAAPAPAPMAAPAPAAPSVYYRSAPPAPPAPPPPPAPAAPAPAPAPQAAPQAPIHVEVTGSRIARSDKAATEPRAEQWLSLLTELLDRHLDDDARDNWARFRREFPDYPVPPALQARIDALQRTP